MVHIVLGQSNTNNAHRQWPHFIEEELGNWSSTRVCFRSLTFSDLQYINDIYLCSNKLGFYLFADDTNLLYADNDLKTLKTVINKLNNVCHWLNANKLTINAKKSNFVLFRPAQKRINHQPWIRIPDNNNNGFAPLECKEYVKFLGVLIDKNLTWRPDIDQIASKISKIVRIIARLRHHVPLNTLLQIYRSLIFPYTLNGLPVWGQASQCDLKTNFHSAKACTPPNFLFQQKISRNPSFCCFQHLTY